ncbi:hypothetical protein B5M09_003140 [Aphanomyces astaci]|uniref:PCI domain-containing protein n=1 Tax=Aphanomyces astaci TaxID=112090 RepID=A0A3R7WDN7_APHAT|nr:hypothetical protein B5M09_003140 [Aphanomyces astaci]
MSHFFQKPENALKRANELLNTPNADAGVVKRQKRNALEILHEALIAKKNRTWQPTHEVLMVTYLNITIDLQLGRIAKDGLHQYRNLVLAQNPASLEKVLLFFVSESEKRVAEARKHSTELSILASVDLESSQSPEAVMMSTTTAEDSADRTDRALVLPWLRFMWETYRTVLDILRCNTKLEGLYKQVALSAFAFCRTYVRKIEFRRLCEILRTHLYTMQRHEAAPTTQSIRQMRGWEGWSAESVELHLTIRFDQLDAATHLELFTEGFRTVDDIHAIMQFWATPPKAAIMATFYKNLAHIFYVSKNHLLHAFALFKYYTLLQREGTVLPDPEQRQLASAVVLASLSIPIRNHHSILLENAETAAGLLEEKDEHMAALLGYPPTRRQLLDDMTSLRIVNTALPEVAALYDQLDRSSAIDPLRIVSQIQPSLAVLTSHSSLHAYVPFLEELTIHLVLEQLTHVYSSVTLSHFYNMTNGLSSASPREIEQLIVRSRKDPTASVRVRIDHASQCMRFSPVLAFESQAKHLTRLGKSLQTVLDKVTPPPSSSVTLTAKTKLPATRAAMLHRRVRIEQHKEAFEKLQVEKAKADARKKAEAEAHRAKLEADRLEHEAKKRELEKVQKIKEDIARKDAKSILAKLGKDTADVDFDTMDKNKLLQEAKDKALKAKEDAQRKLKDAARTLDHIVRATREAEFPILHAQFQAKQAQDKLAFEQTWAATLVAAEHAHTYAVSQKALYDQCQPLSTAFRAAHEARQRVKVQEKLKQEALRRQVEALEAKVDRAQTRKADHEAEIRRQQEAERKRVELEARAERLREEAAARDAEDARRRQEEEEEAERVRQEEASKPKKYTPPIARDQTDQGDKWSTVPRAGSRRFDEAFKGRDAPREGFGTRGGVGIRSFRGDDDGPPPSSPEILVAEMGLAEILVAEMGLAEILVAEMVLAEILVAEMGLAETLVAEMGLADLVETVKVAAAASATATVARLFVGLATRRTHLVALGSAATATALGTTDRLAAKVHSDGMRLRRAHPKVADGNAPIVGPSYIHI